MNVYSEPLSRPPERPKVTVAAIVERERRFLFVEERNAEGRLVINQPAGHVEPRETLLDAVIRETLEETGWAFAPAALIGIYLWCNPLTQRSFLRVSFAGSVGEEAVSDQLDEDIERALWLTRDQLESEVSRLRSPLVTRCVDDYLAGEHYSLDILKSLLPC